MAAGTQGEMEQAAARAERTGKLARWGHLLFRWRSFTPVPLLALGLPLLWQSRGAPHSRLWLPTGLLLCVLGQALRAWVLGLVPDGTSGQNERLIATGLNTSGPYAHVRNPLYLGNLGITLGLCLVAHSPLLLVLTGLLFFLQYAAIIAVEEAFLRERFGAAYEAFCARVPRFWPRPFRARRAALVVDQGGIAGGALRPEAPWSLGRAVRKEHNPVASWSLIAIVLLAMDRVRPALAAGARWSLGELHIVPHVMAFALVVAVWLAAKGWKHHWLSGNFTRDLKRRIREAGR